MDHHRRVVGALLLGASWSLGAGSLGGCSLGGPPLLEDDVKSGRRPAPTARAAEAPGARRYTPPAPVTRAGPEAAARRYEAPSIEAGRAVRDEETDLVVADELTGDRAPSGGAGSAATPDDTTRVGAPMRVGAGAPPLALRDLDQDPLTIMGGGAPNLASDPMPDLPAVPPPGPSALAEVTRPSEEPEAPLELVSPVARDLALSEPRLNEPRPAQPDTTRRRRPAPMTASTATMAYLPDPASALAAVNAYRAQNGRAPLGYNPVLSAAARAHAQDLARRGEVAATSSDGGGVIERLDRAGYVPDAAASLVAGGFGDFAEALAVWQRDRTESSRLLLEDATEIGIALVEDRRSPYRYYIETIVAAP